MSLNKKQNKQQKNDFIDKLKPEHIFLVLATVFGLLFVFINPPWQTNDEDRHFYHAYFVSQGYFIPEQGNDKVGGVIANNLYDVVKKFQGIRFSETNKISKSKLEELENIKLNESNKQFFHNNQFRQNPIGYLAAASGIFIGQVINDNPVWLGWWGRIGNLIFYIVVVFFAIKLIPIFKNVVLIYALTPMVIYQGASVTYDAMMIALTFLILALVLKYSLEKEIKIGWKEITLLIILLILHSYCKGGYPLVTLSLLMIPKEKFNFNMNPIVYFISVFILTYVIYKFPAWTWGKLMSWQHYQLETSKALQKDFKNSWSANVDLALSNPGVFISNIIENINHFRQEWAGGTIGRFGYSYTLLPSWFFLIHGLIIIFIATFDNAKEYVLNVYQRSVSIAIGIGTILIVIAGMYFASPIGAKQIFGLQGRYFIPAIPFLLLSLYNHLNESIMIKKYKTLAIGVYIILILSYTLSYLNDIFYTST